jgi:hypothetical protein
VVIASIHWGGNWGYAHWLERLLDRQGRPFGTGAETTEQGELVLRWK